jgi:tRNA pseudouridine38-40 synthase
MDRAEVRREGDLVVVELEASGFMRQMVRTIVGTLIWVGLGQIEEAAFKQILLSADRTVAAQTAPAHGLYLLSVLYPEGSDRTRAESETARPPLQGLSPLDS